MADLIDRISGEDGVKINLHRFMGVQRLYAFGEWTRGQIATEFNLQGAEATQAGALADKIDGQPDANTKALYILRAESVMMCIEDHNDTFYHSGSAVNKTKVYEDLLFT
jgi:hypothetical protein